MSSPQRITIIGAGFGALSSVREIRRRDPAVQITLVSPRAELHYLPGIIWIPSGLRRREQLVLPLANFFARMQVTHVAAEVTGLRDPCRQLDRFQPGLMAAVLGRDAGGNLIRKAGVMGVVLAGGEVRPGDPVRVELPPEPHRKLDWV